MESKKITFKAVHPLVSVLWFAVVLVLLFLLLEIVQTISYMGQRTYIMISIFAIILIVGYRVLRKQIKQVELLIKADSLEISEQKIVEKKDNYFSKVPFNKIKNYNVYYMLTKKMGYIIRIKADKTYIYYVDWISLSGSQKFDTNTYKEVKSILDNKMSKKKKTIVTDILLLLFSSVPWITFIGGMMLLLGIFYYIFFMI
ncbi:hypothetical protein [Apibacter sp. HY039]|uniref:hypothetical protein n=1 Tax=Apibacter sp. HY039 TaxID=2501476 RepID=UPI000FEBEBC8|nr:hypothetical protein [Apibacter sp. HY039]